MNSLEITLLSVVFLTVNILSLVYGYYLGVRNTMDYYAFLLNKRSTKSISKAEQKFDNETDDTISSTKTYN